MAFIKVTRSHMAGGIARRVGEVYETGDRLAAEIVMANKAEYTDKPKPKRGAMTTKTAAALTGGKEDENA